MVIYELFCEVLFMWCCWWSALNFLYEGIIMFIIIIIIIIRPFCLNCITKPQNRNWNWTVWYTFTVDHIQYVQQWYHTTITRATQEDLMYCQMSSVTSHSYNLVSGPIRRRGKLMRVFAKSHFIDDLKHSAAMGRWFRNMSIHCLQLWWCSSGSEPLPDAAPDCFNIYIFVIGY